MKRRLIIPPLIVVLVLLSACKEENIRKAARASDDMATIVSLAIDVKRGLGQTGTKLISDDEELVLTLGLQKINTAVKAFHAQVKKTSTLDPAAKGQLLILFKQITEAVTDLNNVGVLGIKNPEAKEKIAAVLAGFQVAFTTIQAVLGGN